MYISVRVFISREYRSTSMGSKSNEKSRISTNSFRLFLSKNSLQIIVLLGQKQGKYFLTPVPLFYYISFLSVSKFYPVGLRNIMIWSWFAGKGKGSKGKMPP